MNEYKYAIEYTLKLKGKNKDKRGMFIEKFYTEEERNAWFNKNEKKLYWFRQRILNPASKLPRPIINFNPDDFPEKFVKYSGNLQKYFETGMEAMGLILDREDIKGPPNPNFDPSKPEGGNNFKNFSSYEAMVWFENGMMIKIGDGPIIGLLKDRQFAKDDSYRISFYPQGFTLQEWMSLFATDRTKATVWVPIKDAK